MTYTDQKCLGSCLFCPQGASTHSKASEKLSRVQWPEFEWPIFCQKLEQAQNTQKNLSFLRICIQTLNYPGFFEDVVEIIAQIRCLAPTTPISTAIPPVSRNQMQQLKEIGLDRIGIAFDACTPELFDKIKGGHANGPYRWESHKHSLQDAIDVFGAKKVTTHVIVGLGETEEQMVRFLAECIDRSVMPGIFMFTPVRHTPMETHPRPTIQHFRKIQLVRYLLLKRNRWTLNNLTFFEGSLIKIRGLTPQNLHEVINKEVAFYTAGCPGCNRPNYTSRPGQEHSGFPRKLLPEEKEKIWDDLNGLICD